MMSLLLATAAAPAISLSSATTVTALLAIVTVCC